MKKSRIITLGLCLMGAFAMSSCNDGNDGFVKVGVGDGKTGIECSNLDQIVEIPVESNGNWAASLPDDCDWVTLLTDEGSKNGVIRLVIDLNSASEDYTPTKRSTTLNVKCGDQTSKIELTQFAGASATDPGDNSDEGSLLASKGVGMGFNLLTCGTKGQIFNVNVISDSEDAEIKETFTTSPIAQQSMEVHEFDSLETKKDSLGVELEITVAYGSFKLELKGAYHSYETKASANFRYGQVALLPRQEAALGVLDLVALAEEDETLSKSIFKAGFRKLHKQIITDFNAKNMPKFEKGVRSLLEGYGPVVVTGATLGGQVSFNVQADSTLIEDVTNIKGMASLAFKAIISIEGKVEANYKKAGTEIMKKSFVSGYIQGGSNEAIGKVSGALHSAASELSSEKLNEAMVEWSKTVEYSPKKENNKTEVIEYQFTGIWNLFPSDMMEGVRDEIVKTYNSKGQESMLDIEKFQIKPKK